MEHTRSTASSRIATHGILAAGSMLAVLPLVQIFLVSLYPPGQPILGLGLPESLNFENYARAWESINFGHLLSNSLAVTFGVVTLTAVVSILSGYAFGTMTFWGKRLLFALFIAGLIMPFFSMIVPVYYNLRSLGLVNSFPGVILVESALFLSFGTYWMANHFRGFPRELTEAAKLDGSSSFGVLWGVILPNSRPAITTLVTLLFMWSWNEFFLVLVLAQDAAVQTAPLGLSYFVGQYTADVPALAAASIMVALPVIVVYVFLQRHFIQGVLSGSIK